MISERSRALLLLWTGAVAGLGLAIVSLTSPATPNAQQRIPPGAVAVVNGELILQADYDAELRRVAERERRPLTARDKQAVVQRLIEDELMIERGIELGMVRGDSPTRRSLLGAVFASERAVASAQAPTPEALEQFYREAAAQLEQPGKVQLRQITIRVLNGEQSAAAHARAEEVVRRLRDRAPFEQVRSALGSDAQASALPDRPLSVDELRDLLGPVTLAEALKLQPGEISGVLGSGSLLRVLQMVDRGEPELPPLQQIRERVLRLYELRAGDRTFEARVAAMRKNADIRVVEALP